VFRSIHTIHWSRVDQCCRQKLSVTPAKVGAVRW
jgi:hypothetical protein